MKTKILTLLAIMFVAVFTGCSKDDDEQFDYPMEQIHGTWDGTDIYLTESNEWIDITRPAFDKFQFSIKFNSDGSYYGSGYFGNGGGTYKATNNTIITYISGEEYARYTIKSLSNNNAELTMSMGTESINIKVEKR